MQEVPAAFPVSSPSARTGTTAGRPARPASAWLPAPGDYADDVTEHSGVLWCIYCRVSSSSNSCRPAPSPHTPALLAAGRPEIPLQEPGLRRHGLRSALRGSEERGNRLGDGRNHTLCPPPSEAQPGAESWVRCGRRLAEGHLLGGGGQ